MQANTPNPAQAAKPEVPLDLLRRAQAGDRTALDELKASGQTAIIANWSESILLLRLQDRAGKQNHLARAAVAHDLETTRAGLVDPSDGPIERLLVRRAALAAVDADLADREHVCAVAGGEPNHAVAALERRRDRAHRRLLSTLRTLSECRRPIRTAVQVNVSVPGDRPLVTIGG